MQELTEARTHDALWNAAQRRSFAGGCGYLRMLWGKKDSPVVALAREALGG